MLTFIYSFIYSSNLNFLVTEIDYVCCTWLSTEPVGLICNAFIPLVSRSVTVWTKQKGKVRKLINAIDDKV